MSVWNQTSKKGQEGDFEKAPPGNHPAVCVAIIDMGTQRQEFKGKVTWPRRALFVWELVTKKMTGFKDKNHVIGLDLTVSLNEKAKLKQWIEARTGKQIAEGAEYDISKELGGKCLLNVVMNGDYPKVNGMSAVPDGLPFPAHQNKPFILSLEEFQAGKTDLPEWVPYLYGEPLVDHIRRCKEIAGGGESEPARTETTKPALHTPPDDDDDAPPPDEGTPDPDPNARWDIYDGKSKTWLANQTTAQVQNHIDIGKLDSAKLYIRPTGTKEQKRAHEYGFTSGTPVAF